MQSADHLRRSVDEIKEAVARTKVMHFSAALIRVNLNDETYKFVRAIDGDNGRLLDLVPHCGGRLSLYEFPTGVSTAGAAVLATAESRASFE
jgi:hypothetical protein